MATFTGTDLDELITSNTVSPSVTATPPGSKPGLGFDLIIAGGGNDIVAAGSGNDTVLLGAGDDFFTWSTGDDNDTVDGGAGLDTVIFRGNDGNDDVRIGAVGNRAVVERDGVGGGSVSMAGIEIVRIKTGIGDDAIEVLNLLGTEVRRVEIDLGSADAPGPDSSRDAVDINGDGAADEFLVAVDDGAIVVKGLGADVAIVNQTRNGEVRDALTLKGFGGDDTLDLSRLPADTGMDITLHGDDGNDTLVGTAGAQSLIGGTGDDLLIGGAGADLIVGGVGFIPGDTGIDTASYATSSAAVNVNLATGKGKGGHAEGDQLFEVENLIGSKFRDTLTGDDNANRIDGGRDADTMAGGKGDDIYIVDHGDDRVIEKAGEGIDTVRASITHRLRDSIEKLVLTGKADINGFGNGLANKIAGNDGDNIINGEGGADVMAGGKGDDQYVVDDAGDTVIEAAGAGNDTVLSRIAFTLGANVENLTLFSGSLNRLAAAEGAGSADIAATGNVLANAIEGNAGNNLIAGKEGNDILAGGGGRDRFLFDTELNKRTNVDLIVDFKRKKDKILLDADIFEGLDAGKLGKEAFLKSKKKKPKAKDEEDRILYSKKSGALFYDEDGEGGAKAVKFAVLDDGPKKLSHKDFLIET